MILCPIAIAAGCEKCPVFKICPMTSIIGDQKKPDASAMAAKSGQSPAKKDS